MRGSRREGSGVSSPPKGAHETARIWAPPPGIFGVQPLLRLGALGADTSMLRRPPITSLPAMTMEEAIAIARRRSLAVLAILPLWAWEMVMMPEPSEDDFTQTQ
jgi:hypothetical protein